MSIKSQVYFSISVDSNINLLHDSWLNGNTFIALDYGNSLSNRFSNHARIGSIFLDGAWDILMDACDHLKEEIYRVNISLHAEHSLHWKETVLKLPTILREMKT